MSRGKGFVEDGMESKGEKRFVSGAAGVIGGRSLGFNEASSDLMLEDSRFSTLALSLVLSRAFNLGARPSTMSLDFSKPLVLTLTGDTTGSVLILSKE